MDYVRARLERAVVGRYQIERELGRGGMSFVYLAQDLLVPRKVAIKVLNPDLALAVSSMRFRDEIRTLSRLTHPYVVSIFAAPPDTPPGEESRDDCLYFVMEYVEGETLADRIARTGPLPVEEAVRIAREVADALEYAHQQGVIHRDIKPGNILLSGDHAWVADFGIARAIAGDASTTVTGVQLGTPAYMSPEQATSGAAIDGRSDIYSLGCVLFEALTGRPPFMGDSPRNVLVQHLTESPPRVRSLRRAVPPGIERIVHKALEKQPGDRFSTAARMKEALELGDVVARPFREIVRAVARPRWIAVAAVVVVAVLLGWYFLRPPALNASLYVVVPFGHRGGAAPQLLDGDRCEAILTRAFARWRDVSLVNGMNVRDAMARFGITHPTLEDAHRIARFLRAGQLVWGEVAEPADSIEVTAAVYDLTRPDAAAQPHTVRIDHGQSQLGPRFYELADSLLLRRGSADPTGASAATWEASSGTTSRAAFFAYLDGKTALQRWDLDSAEAAFLAALRIDAAYPHAHLELAHTRSWAGRARSTWRDDAEAAAGNAVRLSWPDSALALALFAAGQADYPRACAGYSTLLQRDSSSFPGWFGLADCNARDSIVLRDRRSSSGWRFRSSYHTAAQAYSRALRMIPSMHLAFRGNRFDILLSRLRRVLFTETRAIRLGYADGNDTTFAAFAELRGDTIAFTPYPREYLFAAREGALLRTSPDAVRRGRETLRSIVTTWIAAFPLSPDPYEALAHVLETTGEIAEAKPEQRSALMMVRRARALARDRSQALRLAVAETRLLIKLYRFAAAKRLADVELDRAPNPEPVDAPLLAGFAALTGRAHRTANLLSTAASAGPFDPLPLAVSAAALQGYAAVGRPSDSITTIAARVDREIQSLIIQPARRPGVRDTLLSYAVRWAWPLLGPPRTPRTRLDNMEGAALRGDTATVVRLSGELRELRTNMNPGEIALDATLQEARVLAQVGQRDAAARQLDASLNSLETHGTGFLPHVEQAAALGRAMELRVDLALRAGDSAVANRWATELAALWSDADVPELRVVADSMRRIGRRGSK